MSGELPELGPEAQEKLIKLLYNFQYRILDDGTGWLEEHEIKRWLDEYDPDNFEEAD